VWWKCSKGHSWYKLIGSMIRDKSCPYCSGEILEGENYNNISPALEEEWDYQRNNPWTPENFTRQSNRSVFWKCENGHSYSKSIYARGRGVGCPVCKKLGLR
jgi:hypothetical protein